MAANNADHARIRRFFSHGPSPSTLQRQESIVDSYISIFYKNSKGKPVQVTCLLTSSAGSTLLRSISSATSDSASPLVR